MMLWRRDHDAKIDWKVSGSVVFAQSTGNRFAIGNARGFASERSEAVNEEKKAERLSLSPALGFLEGVWRFNHALERASLRMEATLGVTAQQRLIIRCVGKYPGMTSGQLATLLHLDPGTISTSLGRLERKGLLQRRQDHRDKRRVILGLTAAGRALDVPMAGTIEHVVERWLASTSAEETAAARRMLDKLTELLYEEVGPEHD
jgi:MarR family transcriptional regulator, organic hydroperoxide resistance regulator